MGLTWLDRLVQDLSYAARMLARSPGFTLLAVLVLAIGIGVNVAAFTAFNVWLRSPLPVRDPGSLVRLERRSPNALPIAPLLPAERKDVVGGHGRDGRASRAG